MPPKRMASSAPIVVSIGTHSALPLGWISRPGEELFGMSVRSPMS
jgi:hypothetical protein